GPRLVPDARIRRPLCHARLALPRDRRAAVLRARRNPRRAGVFAGDQFAGRRSRLRAHRQRAQTRPRRRQRADAARRRPQALHSAKGLEFDSVFLPGWEEGLFPHQRALDEQGRAGLEEERRLAHVGLTRARRRAKLYFATNRRIRGTWSTTIPSRFLDELPAPNVEITESKGGSGWGGSGGYGASRFDNIESFGSSYTTPGWQRAQANRARGQSQARGGFEESQSSFSGSRGDASGSRGDAFAGGFSRNKRGPIVIE